MRLLHANTYSDFEIQSLAVTFCRVWLNIHDRAAFKAVWEEIFRLVMELTRRRLGFKALHKNGTLIGYNADMEPAPLLALADALYPTVDIEGALLWMKVPTDILAKILRICLVHLRR